MNDERGILLSGLDGSNPLAFLAALGTLRTLALGLPNESVKMGWELADGAWRPRVFANRTADQVLSILSNDLVKDRTAHGTRFVGRSDDIAAFYRSVRQGDPVTYEQDCWIAALTNDLYPNATSQLQTTRRDYFAGNLDVILANADAGAIQRALFNRWRYDDKLDGQSLHLEPSEDRRHAYQWNKPNGDPNRKRGGNMLGANRLAIEAIPLFLGLPSANPDRLRVVGWSGVFSDDSRWTWPIWHPSLSISLVPSLLSIRELQIERPDCIALREMGIVAAFRCRRILVEQTPNLTPAASAC